MHTKVWPVKLGDILHRKTVATILVQGCGQNLGSAQLTRVWMNRQHTLLDRDGNKLQLSDGLQDVTDAFLPLHGSPLPRLLLLCEVEDDLIA